MKKTLLIILLLISSLSANIEWMEYDKALSQAKNTNDTLIVMLGRESCGVCRYMKKVVFNDKNVIKKLETGFIGVYIELDFDDVPKDLTYIGTPTFYFIDKNENIVSKFDGGKTVPSFLKALDEVK